MIDERRGRDVATRRKIKTLGTGAVLLAAKQRQYIDNTHEPLMTLVEVGYWLSPQLGERLLFMAGEGVLQNGYLIITFVGTLEASCNFMFIDLSNDVDIFIFSANKHAS